MPHAFAATTATTPHILATTTTHASQLPMPTLAEKTPSPPPGRKLKLHCSTPTGKKTSTPLPNSQSPHHAARSSISHSATPPLLNSTGKKTSTPLPNFQGPHHAAMTSNSRSATPPLLNSTGKKTSTPPPNSQSPHQAATTPHPETKQVFHLTPCYSSPSATPPLLQQFSFHLSPKNPLRNTKPTGLPSHVADPHTHRTPTTRWDTSKQKVETSPLKLSLEEERTSDNRTELDCLRSPSYRSKNTPLKLLLAKEHTSEIPGRPY